MGDAGDPQPGPLEAAGSSGRVLAGRFRIERVLGRGGMGEVLLAHDTLLGRRVALKRLRSDGSRGSAERRVAALKEARRASQVADRRIAAIHDVLEMDDELVLVMEYVEGETLRAQLIAPMPLDRFWDLSQQCLEALEAAHAHGVIHRDIKPENLMLTRDREIKVLDFGLAWRSPAPDGTVADDASTATTESNRVPAGTPRYMAPEAHYGGRIDERTDLFALGAVFYEMLTARHPFDAATYGQVLDRIMNSTPRPAGEVNPAVSPELSAIVSRMLARDPAQRFASCAEVRVALNAAMRARGVAHASAVTAPALPAAPAPRRRHRARARWVAGVALGTVGVATWLAVTAPRLPAERRLAVLAPATPNASADFRAYAVGSTELLGNRLSRLQDWPGFQIASFAETYPSAAGSAGEARRSFGSNLALIPTIELREDRLLARLELRSPDGERVLGRRVVDVPVSEPFMFADSLYHSTLAMLGLPRRRSPAQADVGVRGAGTLRFLLQGIGRRRAAETVEEKQRALADLENAHRTEPGPAAPLAWLALAQVNLFNATKDSTWLARAEASAREAIAIDSSRPEPHRALGTVLTLRKRPAEALAQYRSASELEPTDDDLVRQWGRTWLRLGKPEEERKVYLDVIARRPHCFKPRWWLAAWEYANGHIPEAIGAFREMIRCGPEFWNGYASLGGLLLYRGEYDRAIDTLRLAVRLNPNAPAYSNLGTAYFSSGKLSQAVDAYNQAFQFGDADHVLWMNLGDAYFYLRDRPDQARDAYRQAVRLGRELIEDRAQRGSSPDPMIAASLSTIYPKLDAPDSARVMLRQALALDSLNSRVQYQAALTLWQLGEMDAAVAWLRRAVAGGFPVVWLRDSPVHRDWDRAPGFRGILAGSSRAALDRSPTKGEAR